MIPSHSHHPVIRRMELWVLITVAAAFLQNIRSALQKYLKARLTTTGATFVRFGFGAPFALLYLAILHWYSGYSFPEPNLEFYLWAIVGGLSQIAATFLLVSLFSYRNFAVGTAYSRTEPAQAALFGLIFLGEKSGISTLTAILVCVIGVMTISVARTSLNARSLALSVAERPAVMGIASGTLFGIAAVAYRAASLSLGGPNFMMQAAITLAFVIILQSVLMFLWIAFRDPAEIGQILKAWRPALLVGAAGATASFGWFMAMTLQHAAVVKALAQIEMIFTFASSVFFFREHINRMEVIGCALIVAGILILMLI